MKRTLRIMPLIGTLMMAPAVAQEMEADAAQAPAAAPAAAASTVDMQALRQELQENKKKLVSQNMTLTQEEANKFWPVYDAYQKELDEINQRIAKIMKSYVADFESQSLTDDTAKKLVEDLVEVGVDEAELLEDYVPKFSKVLPKQKVLRYVQLENKLRALVRFDIAANVPLQH